MPLLLCSWLFFCFNHGGVVIKRTVHLVRLVVSLRKDHSWGILCLTPRWSGCCTPILAFRARIHERKTKRNRISKPNFASCASQGYVVYGITNHVCHRWLAWLAFHESQPRSLFFGTYTFEFEVNTQIKVPRFLFFPLHLRLRFS
ncbi:hypothetical protein Y032_0071g568 [Ancylostoma ceylanicum]|uniref:Secreted protein n=1 Tax=Ancylostoma ceylanicum TaxID=53326 RepID=A0A016TWT7_9BILA|nr:hypothetical protein Y032_0071g568 [Ancylostoma ceylanicum]